MDNVRACAFTGYRPEKFPFEFSTSCSEYIQFENTLYIAIISAIKDGYNLFYSGGAKGFDILAAELVLLLKKKYSNIKLYCALPFKSQNHAWDDEWKKRYSSVLDSADDVIYLADKYSRGCYDKRNRYMIAHSEGLITFFDGKSGGTASTVRMAEKKGMEIINTAEKYKQMKIEL